MNCPSCGAPMKLKADMASFKCEYCQSVCFPEKNDDGVRVLEEQSGHDCPVCSVPLNHAYLGTSPIIYCTKCNGMLIAMGGLEGMIDEQRSAHRAVAAPPPPDKDDLKRKINCPQCHRPMDAHFYGGPGNVVIDSCEECSLIWLDRGELLRIALAPDSAPESTPSPTADFDSQTAGSWSGAEGRTSSDVIEDGIFDAFFK
ncbi:MAG: zf-TFIIB domain-containing protein [Terracidiphilus sp.]